MAEINIKKAAIIVIGDEILKGQTLDTNSNLLCKQLFDLGIKVKRMSVIEDDVDVIATEVQKCSSDYDFVFTSGGIGPTHDDVTYEGVAKAFKVGIRPEPTLVKLIELFYSSDGIRLQAALKMADVPETSRLLFSEGRRDRYPFVAIRNVYILAGVPVYFKRSLLTLMDSNELQGGIRPFTKNVYINLDEVFITPVLNKLVATYKGKITIGSYPIVLNSFYKVKLALETFDKSVLEECVRVLEELLPLGSIVPYEADAIQKASIIIYDFINNERSEHFLIPLRKTIEVLEEAFQRYPPSEICICFPGGKDCTALLHLVHTVHQKHYPDSQKKLKAAYFQYSDCFPEVEQFIKDSALRYNLELFTIPKSIKEGLRELLTVQPEIKAMLVGNRRTDPYSSNLSSFVMTDSDWPQIMRVCPLLDWSYSDVWDFLRNFSVQYCCLYDRGFTSLGCKKNTFPNSLLKYVDNDGQEKYHPAYTLQENTFERNGRSSNL